MAINQALVLHREQKSHIAERGFRAACCSSTDDNDEGLFPHFALLKHTFLFRHIAHAQQDKTYQMGGE